MMLGDGNDESKVEDKTDTGKGRRLMICIMQMAVGHSELWIFFPLAMSPCGSQHAQYKLEVRPWLSPSSHWFSVAITLLFRMEGERHPGKRKRNRSANDFRRFRPVDISIRLTIYLSLRCWWGRRHGTEGG